MRRKNRVNEGKKDFKSMLYVSGGILVISIIAFIITFVTYTNKLNNSTAKLNTEKIAELVPNETESTEASSQMGKTVEESENEIQENNIEASNANIVENTNTTQTNTQLENKTSENTTKTKQTTTNTQEKKEEVKDPEFIKPVEGEIMKGFANENLVYSETLKEWTTHNGIDIAAAKTTVVQAAAEGTVTAIKNDPRYGTTVIIEHANGFETRYSNLLTAEFVVAGEKVEQGQSIGTLGNSAMFEVADESHLHFEILKDSEALNPENYIK